MGAPRKLPHRSALQVDEAKVVSYLLNLDHPQGGPKARYFIKRGFDPARWQEMAAALGDHGATQPVIAVRETRFGKTFTVQCTITTPDGRDPCITTAWIAEGTMPPRLVTAHPAH